MESQIFSASYTSQNGPCTSRMLVSYGDTNGPEYSETLINLIGSYVNSKLGHERKSIEFITELRQKLYFLHEYNCQLSKVIHKYPRSRKFDLLLIKYVELEFDLLHNYGHPSVQLEITVESRVLRLLQVMLYPAVVNDEALINRKTDLALKRAVLQLLGEVRPGYLVKNKLVYNIASKLLKKIGGKNKGSSFKSPLRNTSRNPTTSDYGTEDSDSDIDSEVRCRLLNKTSVPGRSNIERLSPDCVEVPLLSNGVAGIPTIEFVDDDNYLVYLEKQKPRKRKNKDEGKTGFKKKKSCSDPLSNKDEVSLTENYKFNKRTVISNTNVRKSNKDSRKPDLRTNDASVIICCDSDDEICDKPSNADQCVAKEDHINKRINNVVTFEILDDEDDDDSNLNYMVYLQKEVNTHQKLKKQKRLDATEIIICSDSDDDVIIKKESIDVTQAISLPALPEEIIEHSAITATQKNQTVPLITKSQDTFVCEENVNVEKSYTENNILLGVSLNKQLKVEMQDVDEQSEDSQNGAEFDLKVDHEVTEIGANDTSLDKVSFDVDGRMREVVEEIKYITNSPQNDLSEFECKIEIQENEIFVDTKEEGNSHFSQDTTSELIDKETTVAPNSEGTNFTSVNNEKELKTYEIDNTNFLVDPSVVFQEAPLNKNKQNVTIKNVEISGSVDHKTDGKNALGDPLLSDKMNDSESGDNCQECRINDTLLEEFLLDDTLSLEGRREFEEFEYFLFNETVDRQESYLSSFPFDENETILQPETFDADIQSLESFLDDSHLVSATDCLFDNSGGNCNNLPEINILKSKAQSNNSSNSASTDQRCVRRCAENLEAIKRS